MGRYGSGIDAGDRHNGAMQYSTVPVRFERYDERLPARLGDRHLIRLYDGCRWAEGPAYFPASRTLLFSDIPNDRLLRYDEISGAVTEFARPAGYHNGHAVDRQGRLLSCEHGARRVTRREHDGSLTVLADAHAGRPLNSPNDLVEHSDGSIWFTDPSYGIASDYEGYAATPQQDGRYVFKVVPGRAPTAVAADFQQPNGLAFSLDESRLYVADSERGHLRVFDVVSGSLRGGEVFAACRAGVFDGLRVDSQDRIWASTADGVDVYHRDGALLGSLAVPETVANLTFGGPRRNDLYLTATTSLYMLRTVVTGAPFPR